MTRYENKDGAQLRRRPVVFYTVERKLEIFPFRLSLVEEVVAEAVFFYDIVGVFIAASAASDED